MRNRQLHTLHDRPDRPTGSPASEADPISAGIARHLCADDDIINNRMERTGLPTDAFDLAVGNVPYSDAIRIDGTVIHDWFIQHSLDAVRPGGLVAVLTSRYTLDKNTSNMRRELVRKAELVAVCRLPKGDVRPAGGHRSSLRHPDPAQT